MWRQRISRFQLPVFFILAFVLTWSVQLVAYRYAHTSGHQISNEDNLVHFRDLITGDIDPSFLPYLLLFHIAFGPSIAGIIVAFVFNGSDAVRVIFRRLFRVRIPFRWAIITLSIPIVWSAVALLVGLAANGFRPLNFNFLVPLALAPALFLYMFIFTGLSEEIGWRGYALPQLQKSFTAERSSWILGMLWGLWHLPSVLFIPYLRGELTIFVALVSVLGLTFGIVGWTIVITWVYNNTESVFWIVVLHALTNTMQSYFVLSSGSSVAMTVWPLIPWIFAIFLLKKFGGKTLTGKTTVY
ncbi:MAG TPA: CPBP family intramembrane glutamic endopeptidase [Microbacteriaceae bacterium]|nr:CPBP family intramembrane glutamic endopeptidase [Microbacteriaceae bacterium]